MSSRLKVILGAMEIGRQGLTEDEPSFEVLDSFLSMGYSELDTALMYAGGSSERIIGRYLAQRDHSKVVVATKANPYVKELQGLTRDSVLKQMATSLSSLQTSCVDIFYLHAPDHNTPFEETLATCQQLYEEGKFKELGLSNFAAWEVADIYHICKRNGWVLPTVYQGMYNPITRMVEGELFPALRHFGIRFYAYNPLAGGMLTGRYTREDTQKQPAGRFWTVGGHLSGMYRDRYWRESLFQAVDVVRKALDESYGAGVVSLTSAAFRWLNHHSAMKPEYNALDEEAGLLSKAAAKKIWGGLGTRLDGIIIGVSRMDHLNANLDSCTEGPLDPRVVQAFDEAWQLDKAHCAKYYR